MSVPFERLGEGQVGRLVYQVIGKDGPIFNPQNIRYLGPEDAGYPSLPIGNVLPSLASNLALGISGLNLLATVANVALSGMVLKEVRGLSRQIEESTRRVLIRLDVIDAKLDAIQDRLKKIDVNVQELHLRAVLQHLEKRVILDDTIDLTEIKKIENDVHRFIKAVDGLGYLCGASFDLSSDVRDRLGGLCFLLQSTRQVVAAHHNIKANGDPFRMLPMDHLEDYKQQRDAAEMVNEFRVQFTEHLHALKHMSYHDYQINSVLDTTIKHLNPHNEAEAAWLWKTDMGLVWRLHKELRALGDYQAEFPQWKRIEAVPLGSNEILVDCTWDKKLLEARA